MVKQFLRYISILVSALLVAPISAQLPYNIVMNETHYNQSTTVIKKEGNVGWNDGVRLGNATGGGFNYEDKYVDIALNTNGIPNVLSATTKGGSTGIDYRLFVSSNNQNYTQIWESENKENTINQTLPKDTKYIRLFYSGNFAGYFKNIKVTELKYLNSPSLMNLRIGQKILNSTPSTNTITIDWCNVPAISYSIEGTHKDKFSVTKIDNNSSIGQYGTATIYLSYIHDDFASEDQPHTATLKLSSNGTTYPITLTGVTDRYIADFNWTIANVNDNTGEYHVDDNARLTDSYTLKNKTTGNTISLPVNFTIKTISKSAIYQEDGDDNYDNDVLSLDDGELKAKNAGVARITASFAGNDEYKPFTRELTLTINKHDLTASMIKTAVWNQMISDPFTVKCQNHNLIPDSYTVTSLTPDIATYDATTNTIQTYFTSGTAQFQIFRAEDRKYKELNRTLELNVNAAGGCDVLNATEEVSLEYSVVWEDRIYEPTPFTGIPNELTFYTYKTAGTAVGDIEVQQYVNNKWIAVKDHNNEDVKIDATTSYKKYGPYTLNESATKMRFYNGYGSYKRYFKDVQVTRKTFLNPQIDGETFYLTQVSSGMQFAGTFPLAWSTCSDEIRFSCDNPNFVIKALDSNNQPQAYIDASNKKGTTTIIVTYSANTANPVLTGELTIYDQSQTKTITLSCEHLIQTIDWPQYFYNLEADENGVINEDITLNAIARAVNGLPTNQPIKYTLSVTPADRAKLSDDGKRLIITGICEGTITASVDGFTDETSGITYSANSLTRQIRIRKAGTPCESYALYITKEKTIGNVWPAVVYDITGLPANEMTFMAHAEVTSLWGNEFYIDFKYNSDDSDWIEEKTVPIEASSVNKMYTCDVPDSVKQVRFRSGSSARSYFYNVKILQKTYITPSVSEITINTLVNQPFEYSFSVDYSDVPLIQYSITNSNNLNLTLTPTTEINNNCGEHGTYTFILRGTSPYLQTGVQEYITITTSAHKDEPRIIPITINSTLGDTYYFDQQDGDWSNLSNWQVNGINPPSLPTPSNPVIINKAATIGTNDATFEGIAYSVTLEDGGSLTVLPKGGLTVHAGGFTGANENNLILHNKKKGAGFIRISPYFTNEMPTIKVLYETTSTLDDGANELAVWQYIGAPGADCQFTVDYITWLYHWSETQRWINKTGNLTLEPFAGYAITQYGKPTYELVAKPINTNQTITLTKTDTGSGMDGDNLFANSFMAPIDVKNFIKEDFEGNIEATFYLFNSGSYSDWEDHKNNNNTLGNNKSVSPGQYCAIPALAAQYLPSDFDITTIPPMQGVYVSAKENNAKIHLDYNRHVWNTGTSTTDMHEPMRAPSHDVFKPDNFRRLRIQINSANSGADRMYVIQDTITTTDYDNGYDAPNQLAEGLANIYTNEHFGQMEVSCSNHIDSTFVGFTAGSDSIYTLRFNAIIGDDLHLLDLDNDSLILLEEDATYTFHATPHSKNDLRFQILLHPEKNLDFGEEEKDEIYTGITDVHTTQVWSHGSCIYINNAPTNTIATLYNISGHKLLTTPIHHTPYTLDLSYLPKGVYMLQLNTQVYKFVIQ